jgi:hypothetical protein
LAFILNHLAAYKYESIFCSKEKYYLFRAQKRSRKSKKKLQ